MFPFLPSSVVRSAMRFFTRILTGLCALVLAVQSAPAGLVGYWTFDSGTGGGTVADLSGNGNNASLSGTLATTPVVAGAAAVPAMKAVNVGGTSGAITVPTSASLKFSDNKFTIAMWMNDGYNESYPRLFYTNAWELQGNTYADGDTFYLGKSPWITTNTLNGLRGAWHHMAITGDGASIKWYLDGTLKATVASTKSFAGNWGTLEIATNTTRISGLLGDVAIFNTAETDIAKIMDRTHPAMAPPPVWSGAGTLNGSGQLVWSDAANWGGITMAADKVLAFATSTGLTSNFNDFSSNTKFTGISFAAGSGAFTLNGNTLNLTGDVVNSSSNVQTLSNNIVVDGGDRTFNTATGDVIVSNGIAEAQTGRGLLKTGANTLTLAGTSTYTGPTSVSQGPLLLNAATLGNTAVTVTGASSKLSGIGSVAGPVTAQSSAHLAPGLNATTTGALTLNNGLTLNAANLDIKAATPGISDGLNVTGNLTLTGTTTLGLTELTGFANGDYVILTYTGSLTGDPATQIIPPTQNASHAYSILTTSVAGMKQIKLHVAAPSAAKTYYVSASGNDSNSGLDSSSAAWKTLAKASTVTLNPGDSILLKCGDTWNEELHPTGNGTATNPILIGAYGTGNKPVIDRQDYTQDRNGIFLNDQAGFKIVGIEFNRCQTGIYGRYSDNVPTKEFLWIEDCYFHDSLLYGGSYANYPAPKNISLGISLFSYERDNIVSLKDITVKNCVFRRMTSAIWTNNPDNFNQFADWIYNFGNFVIRDCLFEEGYQWQLGIRGVAGGAVRACVTVDIGRGFTAFNGVAGAMFFRTKDWIFEDSEWGFISRGGGSGDGEAFDFEGNCDNMTMRNCLFHDTDGPGFLICLYASNWNFHTKLRMENCVLNGKAANPEGRIGKCEIVNSSDLNAATWRNSRFYLSAGEILMKVMDPDNPKRSSFVNCQLKALSAATGSPKLTATASALSEGTGNEASKANDGNTATAWTPTSATNQWLQLDFGAPVTVNEFRIKEAAGSAVTRYAIEAWDTGQSRWMSIFNGRTIGSDFVAPVVSRKMQQVRLWITSTGGGNPSIAEFQAYNDIAGWTFSSPTLVSPPAGNPIPTTTTTTTVTSSLNPSSVGQAVTFTATVACSAGTPTGTVTFKDGAATLGSGTLNGSGAATFSTSALTSGAHSITVVYAGGTYCNTSTSAAISQVVP
ncbi:MAG: Ig-like domain repeat protein [Verrucomicrobiota bacterium]